MIQRMSLRLPAAYRAFRRATWLHVLVVLGAGAALRWPLLALAPFFTTDSRCCYYHYAANQLLAGQPFDSGLHLPPGYSLFLAAILAVTEGSTAAAMLVQHLLGLVAGLLVYLIGRRLFGPLVGLAAALLTVLDGELAVYEHAVMTETLFIILLVGAIGLLVFGVARYPRQAAAGFGLILGLAALVRPVGLPLPLGLLLVPAAVSFGKRLQLTIIAVAGAALILLPVMLWNARTHGQFGLTASLQRSMLNPIEAAPGRLLAKRGSGDPLLGRVKATISHHPTSAWVGPYGRVRERFHLSNAQLDSLLTQVARDFVLADPWGYLGHTLQQLSMHLTTGEGIIEVVRWSRREYALAGGAAALGVVDYDAAANRAMARAFDAATPLLRFETYAWVLLALAAFGGTRYYGRSALLVAVILAITVVSAGTINGVVVRYRYPVTWAIYLLAAVGAAGLFGTLRAALKSPGGRWRSLWPTTIRRGHLPPLVALLVTVVVLIALAAGRSAFARRTLVVQPQATLGGIAPPLSAQLDRLDWHLPAEPPQPRLVALSLPDQLSFDLIGPNGLIPDGQADAPLLLSVRHDVWDLQTHALKFVDLGGASGPPWDTTGWYEPLLVVRIDDGEYLSQHTDPRSKSLKLQIGDRLLVLAAVPSQPVTPEQFGVLRLHLDSGIVLSYPVEAEPLVVPRRDTAPAPQDWLAQYAAASARVAIVQREEVRVVAAESAFSAAPWLIALASEDRAAIRKWLPAETLERQAIQYVWVGNSLALKGEAATAVLDPTRLRPVLLQVQPGECPVRWRGLFVVAAAAAAADAPLVPLTIPHPLTDDEFQGALHFEAGVAGSLAPGQAAMVSLDVTNGSTQRWYGTCSSPTYPVGVAVEGRRSPEAPWMLVGEALLADDLPARTTAQVAVEITAPREAGSYELRARLVQRPDRVSPIAPAAASLVVEVGNDG